MKWYPTEATCCPADLSAETAVLEKKRGRPPVTKRAKMVYHQSHNGTRRWHWSDQRIDPSVVSPAAIAALVHSAHTAPALRGNHAH